MLSKLVKDMLTKHDMQKEVIIPAAYRRLCISERIEHGDLFCFENEKQVTQKAIEEQARFLWEVWGKPSGRDKDIWMAAENKLLGELWKPHMELIGSTFYGASVTIRKHHSSYKEIVFVPTQTAKSKVGEYLKKLKNG